MTVLVSYIFVIVLIGCFLGYLGIELEIWRNERAIKKIDRNIEWLENEAKFRKKANEMICRWRMLRYYINGPEVDGQYPDWYEMFLKPYADGPVEVHKASDVWKDECTYEAIAAYIEHYADVMKIIEETYKTEGLWPFEEDDELWD